MGLEAQEFDISAPILEYPASRAKGRMVGRSRWMSGAAEASALGRRWTQSLGRKGLRPTGDHDALRVSVRHLLDGSAGYCQVPCRCLGPHPRVTSVHCKAKGNSLGRRVQGSPGHKGQRKAASCPGSLESPAQGRGTPCCLGLVVSIRTLVDAHDGSVLTGLT